MECQRELGHPSFEPIFADYYEGGKATITCSRGHESVLMVQSQKFEVLLESGVAAYLDSHTIEASLSFSIALERFFEFCIRVFCKSEKVDAQEFDKSFKQMSHQSERQIGAFLSLFLLKIGRSYKINEDIVQFRNKIVHKGYIPSSDEVDIFASKVYKEIYDIILLLRERYSNEMQNVIMDDLSLRAKDIPAGIPVATSTGTIFFCLAQAQLKATFHEALSNYKEARKMIDDSIPYMEQLHMIVRATNKTETEA
jgi:hypothetical protein